jgi:hypothetical protein
MWDYLLHRILGISGEGPDQVRLGAGIVAFTAYVLMALCAAAGGISWALHGNAPYALGIVAILSGVVVYFVRGTWQFAHDHPDQAALGGTWWFKLRQLQMGSKNQPEITPQPAMPDPRKPLPSPPKLLDAPDAD